MKKKYNISSEWKVFHTENSCFAEQISNNTTRYMKKAGNNSKIFIIEMQFIK